MMPKGKRNILRLWTSSRRADLSCRTRSGASVIGRGLLLVLMLASQPFRLALAAPETAQLPSMIRVVEVPSTRLIVPLMTPVKPRADAVQVVHTLKRANFGGERASADARQVADWAVDSGDSGDRPFVIVDKIEAKVFVFDAVGNLSGAAPALLGLARGDNTVPGIGQRKLAAVRPEERTTPAGRFVASLDLDVHGHEVLWVDYDAAIAMHRVVTSNPSERRLQRMDSLSPLEHRISYGCINVPSKFYDNILSPAFKGTSGIVYILPETRPAAEVFASYVVGEPLVHEVAPQSESLAAPVMPLAMRR
jgi:hypothetical protein